MALSETRSPEVLVLLNGHTLENIIDIDISGNNHLAADRFRLTVALTPGSVDCWAEDTLTVEIRVSLGDGWSSLIYGDIDCVDIDIGRGEVRCDGRDLTSRFIVARTQETFENQTASEIVTALALRRGLLPVVVPTFSIIGRSFHNDYSRFTLDQHSRSTTEWDLLIRLAESEGFDVWTDGQSLNFAPGLLAASALILSPTDCQSIRLRRLMTLSGGLEVLVKSWDCRGQRAVVQSARSVSGDSGSGTYVIIRPNLSDDAAQGLAQRLLTQMSQHERSVSIEMPGDVTTKPRDSLTLVGTGTSFDGIWTISEVNRRISFQEGFVQVLEARMPAWTVF